ncbi:MAG: hypothetical protein V2A61_08320 [Calditrichota bacterium]
MILFDNIQFVYELNLACLELEASGINYQLSQDLRHFSVSDEGTLRMAQFGSRTAYFKEVLGRPTTYSQIVLKNRTRSVNQYLTHWIYPYKGKFHPQMIRALLNIIGIKPGEILFEPFCGSGTAVLEAQLLGINCIGRDVSPLCVLQTRVKTEAVKRLNDIKKLKDRVITETAGSLFSNGYKYRDFIGQLTEDPIVQEFFILARMLALSDESRRNRDYTSSLSKNILLMLYSLSDYHEIIRILSLDLGKTDVELGDMRSVPFPNDYFDGIITSPPYSIALDYVQNDIHALTDLGYDPKMARESFIGVRGNGSDRVKLYNQDIEEVYRELYRTLKPGRQAVIIIGNATYLSSPVDSVGFTIQTMEKLGFQLIHNINKIIFGLYNIMKQENILIFRKVDK